jgi:hypothetical protein
VNHPLTLLIGFVNHQITTYFEQSMVTHFQGNITKPHIQPKVSLIFTTHFVHNTPLKKVFDPMQPFPKLRTSLPLSGKKVLAMYIFFLYSNLHHMGSSLLTIFQIHLTSRQSFILLVSMMPNPPNSFGVAKHSHLAIWYLKVGPPPCKKNSL